jgi:hypothetical protein
MTLMETAQLLGNFGEFLGAIAVFATLIYLATQVRNSNRFEAAKHTDVHMDRIRERFLLIAQNQDLARIERIATTGGDLDEDQAWRWRSLAIHHILCMRDAWLRAGLLGDVPGLREPTIYLDMLAEMIFRNPGMRKVWEVESPRAAGVTWSHDFIDYVNQKLSEKSV